MTRKLYGKFLFIYLFFKFRARHRHHQLSLLQPLRQHLFAVTVGQSRFQEGRPFLVSRPSTPASAPWNALFSIKSKCLQTCLLLGYPSLRQWVEQTPVVLPSFHGPFSQKPSVTLIRGLVGWAESSPEIQGWALNSSIPLAMLRV